MIKVGITGGIGTGKTTVCKLFEMMNIPVYYADTKAKQLMTGNKAVKRKIMDLLGKEAYFKNGRLDRKYISSKVFNNKALLDSLNAIVHPAVAEDFEDWAELHKHEKYILKEAALLIESGSYKLLDKLVLVTSDIELIINRVMLRDNTTQEQVQKRINAQLSEAKKIKHADYVIENSGKIGLILQVIDLHKQLISL